MRSFGRVGPAGAVLCLATLGAACNPGAPGRSTPTRTDSAGVEIVLNEAPDRPVELRFREDFTLGGEADGPEAFYRVYPQDVSVGPDGRIAVLNEDGYQASVFGPDGTHRVTFGREGEGPGEFSYPSAVVALPGGRTGVSDYRKQSVEVFDAEGEYVGSEPIRVPYNGLRIVAAHGGLLLHSRTQPRGGGAAVVQVVFVSETDTLPFEPRVETVARPVNYQSCGVRMTLPPLFSQGLSWSSNGSRTAVVGGPRYSVTVYEGTEPVSIVRRAIEPEAVTEQVALRELEGGEDWGIGGQVCTVPPEEVVEQRGFADFVPVITDVAVDPGGRLWVKRRDRGSDEPAVDLFDASGTYLGTASPAPPFPIDFLPDGRAITVETDEFDVQRLVVSSVEVGEG